LWQKDQLAENNRKLFGEVSKLTQKLYDATNAVFIIERQLSWLKWFESVGGKLVLDGKEYEPTIEKIDSLKIEKMRNSNL
jgi:uncharacterized protein YigA (DUF484 family)